MNESMVVCVCMCVLVGERKCGPKDLHKFLYGLSFCRNEGKVQRKEKDENENQWHTGEMK